MPECFNIRTNEKNEEFLFREPIVLVTIICLFVLNGITSAVQHARSVPLDLINLWNLSQSAVPLLGVILSAFLSDVVGRKPVYIVLSILSLSSTILHAFPNLQPFFVSGMVVHAVIEGGIVVMNAVAIPEYSGAKHRFAWMVGNVASHSAACIVPMVVFSTEVLEKSPYIQLFQLVLGLLCLGSMWIWPESPYWLASKGKLDGCAMSFLWLRGKAGGREELVSVLETRRRRGPAKLFWTCLGIAIATVSVTVFCSLQETSYITFYNDQRTFETQSILLLISSVVASSVLAITSYFVRRRVLFLLITIVYFMLCIIMAFWIHRDPSAIDPDNIFFYFGYFVCNVIRRCGPSTLGMVLFVEIVPQKYISYISCICYTFYYICTPLLVVLRYSKLFEAFSLGVPGYMVFSAFLSLPGAILYYCYAPATKDRTLLEIQRLYPTERNNANSEQSQVIMQNL